ncbi:hypothetical protein E3N86_09025 [Cryobacterium sp. Hz7]|uniref:Uncharacterized protein n=1 Tax=Cryobacterium sandaracinum TaxID=1259247 RepID=A0ABY2JEU2_9MICO|nr:MULTISPECIES: hypothetical protein [Cryobacterium]TFB58942.1 hypothetical protein E3N94_03895 [Cryobacterium sp. Sr3]TFB60399.1 hypothetical protein E3N86_09025 [Cryobacterium sp. Hz7]TFC32673.1 hypothetical protein E3O28_15935 [Cryobacterium sp. TMT2-14]TFC67538.1 hypothetical protein E3O54_08625 [Cryobacterium sp. TMT2-4]TFD04286.1 hypothetical protein E3T25_06095 [Cryobacterium sandaracinum]
MPERDVPERDGLDKLDHRDKVGHRDASVVPRQSVVKSAGTSRRARLTPAPDTDPDPHPPVLREEGGIVPADPAGPGTRGVNDERLRQDRPPHW